MIRRLGALNALFAICFLATTASAAGDSGVPLGKLPAGVTPSHYWLAFTIEPTKERFSGHTEIAVTFAQPTRSFYMDGLDLHVVSATAVLANGKRFSASYAQVDTTGVAQLTFKSDVPAGAAKLVFDYDAPFDKSLAGLYKVMDGGEPYAFTQFENTDARRAFPSFDEPGFKTPFDISITARSSDKVICNTPVVSTSPAGHGMTKTVFDTTKPLPTYLVAMAVGPLDIVDFGDIPANRYRDHPLHLRGVAAKGKGAQMNYAMSLVPDIITSLENYFEISYPYQKLDQLAVPDFRAGAMENSGAITYREVLLLMDKNAPLDLKRFSLAVQAHEITHQWFGDLVTPMWWDDIWLNESFATWNEYKDSAAVRPDEEYSRSSLGSALNVMYLDELPSARQIHQPVNNQDDIDNAFDDITYSKGGAVLSMFESYVGARDWQKGIHAYLTKYAFGNATAHDFISTIAASSNHQEIVQAFDNFINQPHIPLMKTDVQCKGGKATAVVSEATYMTIGNTMPSGSWNVPMCLTAGGNKVCHIVPPEGATISLGASCGADVFPNTEGAGYYRFTLDNAHRKMLVKDAGKLDAAEQLTLFHNLYAGLRAGVVPAGDLFAAVHAMAPNAQYDLIQSISNVFHTLRIDFLPADALPAYRAFVRKNFDPRLAAIGIEAKPGEAPATALARENLVKLLVEEGGDPALLARMAKAAQTFMTSGGKNLGGIPPELLNEALRAGVITGGMPFMDALMEAFKKSDSEFFYFVVINAAAGATDRAMLDKFLNFALTNVRTGDLRAVLGSFSTEPLADAALWDWFKANYDTLLKRISAQALGGAVNILAPTCTQSSRDELEAFFRPKVSLLAGTERGLPEAEETIGRCIALKDAKGAEIVAAARRAGK